MNLRILAGTLRTIENEFAQCCASIRSQTYPAAEHLVLSDLPNREAHITLFRTFVERREEFDLLIKVDADMTLCRDDFFERLVSYFEQHREIHHYQVAVHDFFTDRLIGGMSAYRNTIRWQHDESVFVEHPSLLRLVGENGVLVPVPREARVWDETVLAPSAIHCGDPSPFQAFHFGLHKGLKVCEATRVGWMERALEHYRNLKRTWLHYLRTRDRRLLLACLGGECALKGEFSEDDLPYSNPRAAQVFSEEYSGLPQRDLERMVQSLRRGNRLRQPRLWKVIIQDCGAFESMPARFVRRNSRRMMRLVRRISGRPR